MNVSYALQCCYRLLAGLVVVECVSFLISNAALGQPRLTFIYFFFVSLAAKAVLAGVLWIYSSELSRFTLQGESFVSGGLRAASLVYVFLISPTALSSVAYWLAYDVTEPEEDPLLTMYIQLPWSAHASVISLVVAIGLLVYAPAVVRAYDRSARIRRLRKTIE